MASQVKFIINIGGFAPYRAEGYRDAIDWYLRYLRPSFETTQSEAAAHMNLLFKAECTECSPSHLKHKFTAAHIKDTDYFTRAVGDCDSQGRGIVEDGYYKAKIIKKLREQDPNPNRTVRSGGSYQKEYQRFSWDQSIKYYKRNKERHLRCMAALESALKFAYRKDIVGDRIITGRQAVSFSKKEAELRKKELIIEILNLRKLRQRILSSGRRVLTLEEQGIWSKLIDLELELSNINKRIKDL